METYSFVSKWGSSGIQDGEFNSPYDLTIDQYGRVFVADGNNSRIQRFDKNGIFQITWGQIGTGDGDLDRPIAIFVDSDREEVYVGEYGNNRIQVFDSNGNYLRKWGHFGYGDGEFWSPWGIAMDPVQKNSVFVADRENHRIQVFDINGNYKYKWGKMGFGDGEFFEPHSLVFDSQGNLYVADTNNHRIQKFTAAGTYVDQWGGIGYGNNQFYGPIGLAVDSFNKIYVSEFAHKVKKFDSNGNFITSFASQGSADGLLNTPYGIGTIDGGTVYVVDTLNHRIQLFGLNATASTVAREELVAHIDMPTKIMKNIGTSFVDAWSEPSADGRSFQIDTNGRTQVKLYVLWTKIGTGIQTVRVVEVGTSNVLISLDVVSGRNISPLTNIPSFAANSVKIYKIQVKSSAGTDDPAINGVRVYLK